MVAEQLLFYVLLHVKRNHNFIGYFDLSFKCTYSTIFQKAMWWTSLVIIEYWSQLILLFFILPRKKNHMGCILEKYGSNKTKSHKEHKSHNFWLIEKILFDLALKKNKLIWRFFEDSYWDDQTKLRFLKHTKKRQNDLSFEL